LKETDFPFDFLPQFNEVYLFSVVIHPKSLEYVRYYFSPMPTPLTSPLQDRRHAFHLTSIGQEVRLSHPQDSRLASHLTSIRQETRLSPHIHRTGGMPLTSTGQQACLSPHIHRTGDTPLSLHPQDRRHACHLISP